MRVDVNSVWNKGPFGNISQHRKVDGPINKTERQLITLHWFFIFTEAQVMSVEFPVRISHVATNVPKTNHAESGFRKRWRQQRNLGIVQLVKAVVGFV